MIATLEATQRLTDTRLSVREGQTSVGDGELIDLRTAMAVILCMGESCLRKTIEFIDKAPMTIESDLTSENVLIDRRNTIRFVMDACDEHKQS